ncbi:hypothetical protein ALC56_08494, partial [Trachymyrmex septentrionalis]
DFSSLNTTPSRVEEYDLGRKSAVQQFRMDSGDADNVGMDHDFIARRFSISIRRRTALRCYGALTAPSVREVFLALDFPPGIITSRNVQIRDYSPDCRGDRTKSARACGTSTEEIFLTARCHRVRPTEITDEDSERSSTPVTWQERAGGRAPSPPLPLPLSILAGALSCRTE